MDLVAHTLGMGPSAQRGRPPFFHTKKLAIVGMTASHIHTPWFDPAWTIAAHPCTFRRVQRQPDWWFDLHPRVCFEQKKGWNPLYYKWLQALRVPIFMQEDWPDIPMAIKYPKHRILSEFRAFFGNHVTWMIALAMTEGVTHIGLFGCDYKHEQERGKQRGSCQFWLGMFEGAGGHVILPPGCTLLAEPAELYGYESHDAMGKLIASYRTVPTIPIETPQGETVHTPLTIIQPQQAEGRPPLMKIPGEEPAWERSGHLIHA